MLDIDALDGQLRQATGADASSILGAAPGAWGERFNAARARLDALRGLPSASHDEVFERDRLASLFGCAYGVGGLLERAGIFLSLRTRWARLQELLPALGGDAPGLRRALREALLLRTFARTRLTSEGRDERRLLEACVAAAEACGTLADYGAELAAAGGRTAAQRMLWGAADLGYLVAERPERPLIAAGAFLLARAGDHLSQKAADDAACEAVLTAHLSRLRGALWEAQEAQHAGRAKPVPLAELEQADLQLEALVATLADGRPSARARAAVLGQLLALVAAARAREAARLASQLLDAALQPLIDGLSVEPGRIR